MAALKYKLQEIDTRLFLHTQSHLTRSSFYPFFRIISAFGDGWIYAVIILSLVAFDVQQYLSLFYTGLIAFGLEVPLYLFLKNKFKRDRPQNCLNNYTAKITPSDEFSFPSGHTAAAFVMAILMIQIFPNVYLLFLSLAALVGFSRIYLGVHFPGDILAGAALGVCSGFIAVSIIF